MTFERNDDGQQKVSHCHPAYIEMHAVSGKSKWYHPGIRRPNVGTSLPANSLKQRGDSSKQTRGSQH
jgi:hypothetical protein